MIYTEASEYVVHIFAPFEAHSSLLTIRLQVDSIRSNFSFENPSKNKSIIIMKISAVALLALFGTAAAGRPNLSVSFFFISG